MTATTASRTSATKSAAWRSYFETTQLLTAELERRMKATSGMDIGDYNILLVLSESPDERLRLGGIARAISFGPNRLTYRLDALERRGWVRREPCPDDKRGLEAVLTDLGRAAFRRRASRTAATSRSSCSSTSPRSRRRRCSTSSARCASDSPQIEAPGLRVRYLVPSSPATVSELDGR